MTTKPVTVAEFVAYLQTLDQGAEVNIVDASNYTTPVLVDINFAEHIEYIDFRANPFVKPDAPHYGRRYLHIGLSC